MHYDEGELIRILKGSGVDFTASLPCEKFKLFLEMVEHEFSLLPYSHLPLTREEEGVGICAGVALAGRRPAMLIQSSGIGNMLNALLSLTCFYEFPLAIFISQRGVYKERIEAQLPMGKGLPKLLKGAGIPYSIISSADDFSLIEKRLPEVYTKNRIHAFLLSPAIWENSESKKPGLDIRPMRPKYKCLGGETTISRKVSPPKLKRYEIIRTVAPYLDSKVVVCNLGIPSKELYAIKHQPSNFYMLGSMGMATPIGLGIALSSGKQVVVIDGDGSLLMNPGSLATAAFASPENLTVLAIDNGSYGSTRNQPTLAGKCVDLEVAARGFGIKNTAKVSTKRQLIEAMRLQEKGPRFIHALALPGNEPVQNIPLHHREIKKQVMDFLRK